MKPIISVVIPTFKRPDLVRNILTDLCKQTVSVQEFEIHVVDNNSKDETKQVVDEFSARFPENIFYHLQTKQGAAPTRNMGAKAAKADVVLFLDDDMGCSEKLVAEHLSMHEKHSGQEICALGYFETEWAKRDDIFLRFLKKSEMQNDFPFETDDEVSFKYFYTGNISCSKNALARVEYFDEGYTVYGVEDIDLGYRLSVHNTKIYFNKKALSFHNYNPHLKDFLKKRYQAGISLGYFLSKYPHLKTFFNFGNFPLVILGVGNIFSRIFLYPFVKFGKKGKLSALQYIYFFFILRWEIYKGYFSYSIKEKRKSVNSLPILLK